ncbi:AraC family transcriptional regulator [Gracilimonas sp.]|uniref:AraC family transcriptional regulator n=1 Tax=Gracilimonas sp. TaxID=1974203 RepID=UPI0032EC549F
MIDSGKYILGKGQSLAPDSTTYLLKDFVIGITEYPEPTETGQWHAHKNPLISFVLKGGNIENRKSKQIERVCGSINYYHAYEPHQNIYQVFPSKHLSIEIDNAFLQKYELQEYQINAAIENHPFSKFIFLNILKEVLFKDSFTQEAVKMLFLEMVNHASFLNNSNACPDWVPVLREILNDNWNQQLSLQKLSNEVGVHPVTISGNFRKYFSTTFGEYMRKIKIERSLKMIKESNHSLTQVAYACGFADQSHFTRTFKNQIGFLPKQYQDL